MQNKSNAYPSIYFTYTEYRNLVSNLLKEGKSTGNEQSEDLLKYSELNDFRMHRTDKTITINQEEIQSIIEQSVKQIWYLITEGWCGDAASIVPVIAKIAELSQNKIELRIVLRDENEDFMNQYLTNGARAIPVLVSVSSDYNTVYFNWGPRPADAQKIITDYKTLHGVVDESAKIALQKWYATNKGIQIQKEITALIESNCQQ